MITKSLIQKYVKMILLPIIIDTQDMLNQYTSLSTDNINNMLDNIAKGLARSFAEQLVVNAERELHSSKRRYVNAIRVIDSGKLEGTILLDTSKDKLVQMLEDGSPPFDMKEGFLKSAKVKTGKNGGKYLTIPFRQGVPGTIGEADNFAFVNMDPEAHAIAKNKVATIPVPGGGVRTAGISLNELPAHLQVRQKRAPIKNDEGDVLFKEYEHKTANSAGITRYVDSATGQNSYRSFRRVSEKSDPSAFIHPGIQKYNLIQKTLGAFNTGSELSRLIDNELNKLGLR
jgi:hypothetical protein